MDHRATSLDTQNLRQRSLSNTFRALVLLGFLTAVPLFAVFSAPTLSSVQVLGSSMRPQAQITTSRPTEPTPTDDRSARLDAAQRTTPKPRRSRAAAVQQAVAPRRPPETAALVGQSNPDSVLPTDHFRFIQNRLRQLGAAYFRLETITNSRKYHFFCRIDAARDGQSGTHFEATRLDPVDAMDAVLAKAESWYAAQR